MYKRNNQGWLKHLDFIVIDIFALQVAFLIAYYIRQRDFNLYSIVEYRNLAIAFIVADVLVSVLFNTMHNVIKRGYFKEFTATVKQALLVLGVMAIYMFLIQSGDFYSRIVLMLTAEGHVLLGFLSRFLWKIIVKKSYSVHLKPCAILVCDEARVEEITSASKASKDIDFVGLVLINRNGAGEEIEGVPVVANLKDASEYICREWIDEIYICPEYVTEEDSEVAFLTPVNALIHDCREMGVPVHIRLHLSDLGGRNFVEKVAGHNVITLTANYASPIQLMMKRLIDIIGALVGSAIALIIMTIVGPKIKKESPGPILFKQTRIGQNGKKFEIYKIRSMYMDAEERKKELMKQNRVSDGMMFKMDFDPRIIGNKIVDGKQVTGIGEFIRSHSLDEFPQFFNVLLNQMSLVGTRPPTVDEWEKYKFHHRARIATKPGITGMWQVSGRSQITNFEEVVKLDTEYINNWSVGLDIKILLKTIKVVLKKDGAM